MRQTSQSEYGKLERVLIKRAADAFGSDAQLGVQWKSHNFLEQPDFEKSLVEYAAFEDVFRREGCVMDYLPKDASVTIDSIYCRDAAICTDRGVILCVMGKEARKNEPQAEERKFRELGIPILGHITGGGTVEGGDVAWLDDRTLAVGHTYRTNAEGIRQLKDLLEPGGVEVMPVMLPHYKGPSDVFHLMSILSPVDANLAVVYSPLMPIVFRQELLRRGFQLVEVPDTEFESMGCNVLALAPRVVLMAEGNPLTQQRLADAGCKVYTYKGGEISVKGGGGPTCLTRPIWRSVPGN